MKLISYINNGEPVFSLVEDKDIQMVISILMNDYIGKGKIDTENFTNKLISIKNGKLSFSPTSVNVEITPDPIDTFERTAKLNGGIAYFFDPFYVWEYEGVYKELSKNSYELITCSQCGKRILRKDSTAGYCMDCFVKDGMKNMFEEAKNSLSEEYTEFETLSKIFETADSFKKKVGDYLPLPKVSASAKAIILDYVKKEKLPEKYIDVVVGGFAA